MKIVINATNIGKKIEGIGTYSLNLLKEFSKLENKLEFIVVLNNNAKPYMEDIKFPKNFLLKYITSYVSPDYYSKGHFFRLLYSNFLSIYKPDLIFNTSQFESIFLPCKQTITIHDVIPLLFREFHIRQYFYYKYLLKIALNNVSSIISPSKHTKELLEKFYKIPCDKIHVVYHGISNEYLKEAKNYNSSKRRNYILYVGRISPTKNVIGLLKAFKIIQEKIDCKLVIAGTGQKKFIEEIHKMDLLSDKVLLKGYVTNEEVLDLYKNASLFVFPSLYEGFGLPPLEAMACGCPTVVSKVASLPEVCGDASYYVDPYDIESIADGIYKVLTDENLRNSLIKKGLERVKLFSWEKTAKETLKVIEGVLRE